MKMNLMKPAVTLAIGLFGALVAAFAGLPAPPLLGATLAVSFATLLRLTADIPSFVRNFAFTIIGCSLGSSITPETMANASKWPISLFILAITVVCIILVCSKVLVRYFKQSYPTGIMATSPGALAYVLALVSEGYGDIRSVAVIQSIRLVALIAMIPLLLTALGMHPEQPPYGVRASMGIITFCLIFSLSLGVGLLLSKLRIPAAFFLAGISVNGIAHLSELVTGGPSETIIFIGFTITGSLVGARFSTIPLQDIRELIWASLATLSLSVIIAAGFAGTVSWLLQLPFGQVFVAFAPGGVEAMAAMALSLNYDPAYVAVHHLFRIIFLIMILPLLLKIRNRSRSR